MGYPVARAPRRASRASSQDVEALLAQLKRHGFDLRRSVFVGYLIETGTRREAAYRLRRRAAEDGWQAEVYADPAGWVVRVGRTLVPTADELHGCRLRVLALAAAQGAAVRGYSVEDLHVADRWESLSRRQEAAAPRASGAPAGRVAAG